MYEFVLFTTDVSYFSFLRFLIAKWFMKISRLLFE